MKYGVFLYIKMSFSDIFNKEIMLWEGFYHDFSTKKASASGALPPDPQGNFAPLMIYPGTAPAWDFRYLPCGEKIWKSVLEMLAFEGKFTPQYANFQMNKYI